MEFSGKKVLIEGCGISGLAAARLLVAKGASVMLHDSNTKLDTSAVFEKTGRERVEISLGELKEEVYGNVDLCVVSPGVPMDSPFVLKIQEKQIPIWGEIELAWQAAQGMVLAITGTNGKTTTTALLGAIMKNAREHAYIVGNIGIPYTEEALKMEEDAVTVAEISSFQLETITTFHPRVSAILNITPDHLNRHHTMDNYIAAKMNITKNQEKEEVCVLNYEDEITRSLGEKIPCRPFYFSSRRCLEEGIFLDKDVIYFRENEKTTEICNVKECHLLGEHNYENICAAAAMAIHAGVPVELIRKTILEFRAVEHRIEFVEEINGVAYYNDSKGTNPDAAIKGINAMNRRTCLIGGGYDKDSEYEEWIQSFHGKVKKLVLIGQTKEKIAEAARRCGFMEVEMADSLEEAVRICAETAEPGEAVLLSPACASWGMFKNYEERGKVFKELVRKMKKM